MATSSGAILLKFKDVAKDCVSPPLASPTCGPVRLAKVYIVKVGFWLPGVQADRRPPAVLNEGYLSLFGAAVSVVLKFGLSGTAELA